MSQSVLVADGNLGVRLATVDRFAERSIRVFITHRSGEARDCGLAGRCNELAAGVAFLASPRALCITGFVIPVDGGAGH